MSQVIMTAPEVAALLRVSLWSVYEMTRRGQIPHFVVGRCKRYRRDEILDWASGLKGKEGEFT